MQFHKFIKIYKEILELYTKTISVDTVINTQINILEKNVRFDFNLNGKNLSEKIYQSSNKSIKHFLEIASMISENTDNIENLKELSATADELYNDIRSPYDLLFYNTSMPWYFIKKPNSGFNMYDEKEKYKLYFQQEYIEIYSTWTFKNKSEKFKKLKDNISKIITKIKPKIDNILNAASIIIEYDGTNKNKKAVYSVVYSNIENNIIDTNDTDDENDENETEKDIVVKPKKKKKTITNDDFEDYVY